jgi:hypothetical protein
MKIQVPLGDFSDIRRAPAETREANKSSVRYYEIN